MVATVGASNPYGTSVGSGLFTDPDSVGLVQGQAYPEPGLRYQLRQGWLSESETIPMWGGVGIYELIPGVSGNPKTPLGAQVGRATGLTGSYPLAGFSVFDGAFAMIVDVGAQVPLAASYGQVNSYRLGSGMRIALACDPALAAIVNSPVNTADVAWDFVNQQLIPYIGSVSVGTTNTYVSGTGIVTLNLATSASPDLAPGDTVTVASLAGSGAYAQANGTFTALAGTTDTVLKYKIATGLTLTINDSTGTVTTGSQLTGVEVLDVDVGNCMTVNYNSANGQATWNYNGSCAVVRI